MLLPRRLRGSSAAKRSDGDADFLLKEATLAAEHRALIMTAVVNPFL